ncbi:hypothetical protein GSI_00108 [Ganoderma sinense ZZ0214-1]|uniref:Uncharacterized protein n=1 Tax=Ganoderma sinense ZZ0214-1 TaxID=1077348 RepID=A0A2G8SRN4_9APHY|nr:hypothetical protein GSI_00108 [Ganoderma sinense ZZ0214-1]
MKPHHPPISEPRPTAAKPCAPDAAQHSGPETHDRRTAGRIPHEDGAIFVPLPATFAHNACPVNVAAATASHVSLAVVRTSPGFVRGVSGQYSWTVAGGT